MGSLCCYAGLELVKQKGALKYPQVLGMFHLVLAHQSPGDGCVDGGLKLCPPPCLSIFFVFLSACVPLCAINPGFCLI